MLKYEIKKIFVKTSSKIAVILMLFLTGVGCYCAIHGVSYVNDKGETTYGYRAVQKLKEAKKEWKGELTTEQLIKVINENNRINNTEQAKSKNIRENNIAYSWTQGYADIRDMINFAFGKFMGYDYYIIDSIAKRDVGNLYNNRVRNLKTWLDTDAKKQMKYTKPEEEYIIQQYEHLQTPLYYDYADGWHQLFENISTIIMIMVLILGFLVADIFSCEFNLKTDAIFYSAYYGRNKAVKNKIIAGIFVVSVIYWIIMLLFSGIILGFLGIDGANCPIQTSMDGWRSLYNITFLQEYLLILLGGYIGSLFISVLTMYFSVKTRSTVLAVIVPFIVIFIPSFLGDVSVLSKFIALLPHQLLQVNEVVGYLNLYQVGGKVITALPILLILYLLFFVLLCPILYQRYRKAEIK